MLSCRKCGGAWLEGETHVCSWVMNPVAVEARLVFGAFAGALPGILLAWLAWSLTPPEESEQTALARAALTVPIGAVLGIILSWRSVVRRRTSR